MHNSIEYINQVVVLNYILINILEIINKTKEIPKLYTIALVKPLLAERILTEKIEKYKSTYIRLVS